LGVGSASADWPMYQYDTRRLGRAEVDALAITAQPVTQTVTGGSAVVLSVAATGPSPLSYQWALNGTPIPGAVNSDYTLASAAAANAGSYTVTVTGGSQSVTSSAAVLTVQTSNPVTITTEPVSQTVSTGASVTFSVVATGPSPLTYQWYLNSAAISGAVSASYTIASATASSAGSYTVTVTSGSESATSSAATLTLSGTTPPPPSGRIINLSARANVGTGGNILIAGFVIQGSGSKSVLVRGVGPTLGLAPFNVSGVLATPELTLISGAGTTVATDTSWGGSSTLSGVFTQVGAFSLQPTSADSAILQSLAAGSYTSQLSGVGTSAGVALAEIYDADSGTPTANLVNISARANVGTGANILIAGFVIEGGAPVQLLLRGIGPTLGTSFGVAGAMAQPVIGLYDSSSTLIASDTGWGNAPLPGASTVAAAVQKATAADMAAVGAFSLAAGTADSAMVATLPAGSYTLELSGANGSMGVGLVEVYLMP